MRIGIDIDDTVAQTYEVLKKELLKQNYDLSCYPNMYRKDPLVKELYLKKGSEISSLLPLKRNARRVINKLKDEGNEIYFITARGKEFYSDAYETTYNWLIKKRIKFDKLIVGADDKAKTCVEYNINIFIDDAVKHVLKVKEQDIRGIVYTSRYNKDIKDLERITDWDELLDIL